MGLLTVLRQQSVKVGVALALIMAVTGILAPVVVPHDPNALSLPERYCPPVSCERDGRSHVLGTDHLGRDLLSRIGPSLRINLYIGILGTLLSFLGAWLLVIVRSNRSAALTTDMPGPLLGVPLYGLAILTYFIGVFISLVMVAAVGPSLMFLIILAGVFSSLLPMALVYESIRGDRASSSPVRLVCPPKNYAISDSLQPGLSDGPLLRVLYVVSRHRRAASKSVFGRDHCRWAQPYLHGTVDSDVPFGACACGCRSFLSYRHSGRQNLSPVKPDQPCRTPAGPGQYAGRILEKIGGLVD